MERTFSIIKPDAVKAGKAGAIMQHLIDGGLRPVAMKMVHLTQAAGRGLLLRAQGAPVLRRPGEVHDVGPVHRAGARGRERHRAQSRADGRHRLEEGGGGHHPPEVRHRHRAATRSHGSDAPETAKYEIGFFFSGAELATSGCRSAEALAGDRLRLAAQSVRLSIAVQTR